MIYIFAVRIVNIYYSFVSKLYESISYRCRQPNLPMFESKDVQARFPNIFVGSHYVFGTIYDYIVQSVNLILIPSCPSVHRIGQNTSKSTKMVQYQSTTRLPTIYVPVLYPVEFIPSYLRLLFGLSKGPSNALYWQKNAARLCLSNHIVPRHPRRIGMIFHFKPLCGQNEWKYCEFRDDLWIVENPLSMHHFAIFLKIRNLN